MKKLLFALIICIVFLISCMTAEDKRREESDKIIDRIMNGDKEFASKAYINATDYITRRLKSPSTSNFPISDYTFTSLSSKEIEIRSYFDAQNGFGAMTRTHYSIRLEQTGEDWAELSSWRISDFKMY